MTGRTILKDILQRGGAPRTQLTSLEACVRDFDLVIMRGLPGAGKSTLIQKALSNDDLDVDVASADLYFSKGGTYTFERTRLAQAHEYSQTCAEIALREGRKVIIDNTNITAREVNVYVKLAKNLGASVCVFEIPIPKTLTEALTKLKNAHGVGPEAIERMYKAFEQTRQVPVFHPKLVRVEENAGGVDPDDVLYWGLFLTKKSKQSTKELCAAHSEIDGIEEVKGDHMTLAHSARIKDRHEISNFLSPHLGRRIKFRVSKVAFDVLSTVVVVDDIVNDDIHLNSVAERAKQRLHVTLSHRQGVKPARSVDILDSAEALRSPSKVLTGVLGYWSKSRKKAMLELGSDACGVAISLPPQLTNVSVEKLFVFDCDRTLVMTPSKSDFSRALGRPWRGGGFFDNPKSLAANLPIFPGPALETFHRLKASVRGAKFVLLTGRIEAMEEAVRGALSRFNAEMSFDAMFLRPKAARTAEWKAEVICSLAASNPRSEIISWDDDPVVRSEMLSKLTRRGYAARVRVQDEHFKLI